MSLFLLPSYWLPGLTPDAGKPAVAAPVSTTNCPAGDHTLKYWQISLYIVLIEHVRLKQLTAVNFKLSANASHRQVDGFIVKNINISVVQQNNYKKYQ